MRKNKFLSLILLILPCYLLFFFGCKKEIDYYSYVSEMRYGVYLYQDDEINFKLYVSERETPYASDGIKGETGYITEAYLTASGTPSTVEMQAENFKGEMNYMSVSKSYYLNFSGKIEGKSVKVTLDIDGKEKAFDAVNVVYDGVFDGKTALKCVQEYDGELFSSLTENGTFKGEIYVRLLYDEGCYYYVGVCDRNGNTNAYLVNGENGRIIAERKY